MHVIREKKQEPMKNVCDSSSIYYNSKTKTAIDLLQKRGESANFWVHFEPQTCHIWYKNEGAIVNDLSQTDLKSNDKTKSELQCDFFQTPQKEIS